MTFRYVLTVYLNSRILSLESEEKEKFTNFFYRKDEEYRRPISSGNMDDIRGRGVTNKLTKKVKS